MSTMKILTSNTVHVGMGKDAKPLPPGEHEVERDVGEWLVKRGRAVRVAAAAPKPPATSPAQSPAPARQAVTTAEPASAGAEDGDDKEPVSPAASAPAQGRQQSSGNRR